MQGVQEFGTHMKCALFLKADVANLGIKRVGTRQASSHSASSFIVVFRWTLNSNFERSSNVPIVKVIYSCVGADAASHGFSGHHIPPSPHGPVGDVPGLVPRAAVDRGRRGPCPASSHHFAGYLAPDSHDGVCAYVDHLHPRLA